MSMFRVSTLALGLTFLTGCDNGSPEKATAVVEQRVPVEAVTITPYPWTITSDLPGRVSPVRIAEVRARVAGIVQKRHFIEGAMVNKGDVLFTIEPAPFEAALSRTQGALAHAQAQITQATSLAKRYEPLMKIEAVSRQQYDDAIGGLQAAEASLISARAEVRIAQLDLGYATVRAPITGLIGKGLVTEGSLVGQGETTPMAVVQQMDPIYADFTQSANAVLQMREALADGKLSRGSSAQPRVSIHVDGTRFIASGHLVFSDVTVDPGTGQVTLRAEFPNPNGTLLPGMYVRVSTEIGTDRQAIFVPQRAIVRGSDGVAKVMTISNEGKAEERNVKTGVMKDSEWQITEGLKAGDRLIVKGIDKISAGAPVTVVTTTTEQPQ